MGLLHGNAEFCAQPGRPWLTFIGKPPGRPDDISSPDRPSAGQYATGAPDPPRNCQYRVMALLMGLLPWPRRRSRPFAVKFTHTARPDRSHVCGHAAASPWNRYRRALILALPKSLNTLPCASVRVAAP